MADASGDSLSVDSLTVEQRPAFSDARAACQQQIGIPPAPRPLSEDEIKDHYEYLLQVRECLMRLGHAISDPPSVEAFVESWATGPWTPYADVGSENPGRWQEANEKCPQSPQS